MILPPPLRSIHWQSPDGLMEAGLYQSETIPFYYASLGNRPVQLGDIQALIRVLEAMLRNSSGYPLLLLSCCPGFAALSEEEAQGLVIYAGQYRALQQRYKESKGPILSYIHQIAVGGTYLMHGLSATHKAADPDTIFHDSVPSRPLVALSDALSRGLIDEICPQADWMNWLESRLAM